MYQVFHTGGREGDVANRCEDEASDSDCKHPRGYSKEYSRVPVASEPAVKTKNVLQKNHYPPSPNDVHQRKVPDIETASTIRHPSEASIPPSVPSVGHHRNPPSLARNRNESWHRRRESHTSVLSRIHNLADHLRQHVSFSSLLTRRAGHLLQLTVLYCPLHFTALGSTIWT